MEHEPHPARAVPAFRIVVHAGQRDALDLNVPGREVVEARETVQEGRLAAAGRTHDRDHFAARDFEVHAAKCVDRHRAGVVGLVGINPADDRLLGHARRFIEAPRI